MMIVVGILIIIIGYFQVIAWDSYISAGLAIALLVFGSWCIAKGLEGDRKVVRQSDEHKEIQDRLCKFDYKSNRKD